MPGHGFCLLLAVWGSGVRVPLAPLTWYLIVLLETVGVRVIRSPVNCNGTEQAAAGPPDDPGVFGTVTDNAHRIGGFRLDSRDRIIAATKLPVFGVGGGRCRLRRQDRRDSGGELLTALRWRGHAVEEVPSRETGGQIDERQDDKVASLAVCGAEQGLGHSGYLSGRSTVRLVDLRALCGLELESGQVLLGDLVQHAGVLCVRKAVVIESNCYLLGPASGVEFFVGHQGLGQLLRGRGGPQPDLGEDVIYGVEAVVDRSNRRPGFRGDGRNCGAPYPMSKNYSPSCV